MRQRDGGMLLLEDVPGIDTLRAYGATVVNTTKAQMLANDMAFLSGEIPRITPFEHGLPGQHRMKANGEGWELDELLMDERFVVANVSDKGLIIFTACSHAGVVNVLKHAKETFGDTPIHAVVGGLHLAGPNEGIIAQTVKSLDEFDLACIAAGHCTGWRAMNALANALGEERIVPISVGKQFRF